MCVERAKEKGTIAWKRLDNVSGDRSDRSACVYVYFRALRGAQAYEGIGSPDRLFFPASETKAAAPAAGSSSLRLYK